MSFKRMSKKEARNRCSNPELIKINEIWSQFFYIIIDSYIQCMLFIFRNNAVESFHCYVYTHIYTYNIFFFFYQRHMLQPQYHPPVIAEIIAKGFPKAATIKSPTFEIDIIFFLIVLIDCFLKYIFYLYYSRL